MEDIEQQSDVDAEFNTEDCSTTGMKRKRRQHQQQLRFAPELGNPETDMPSRPVKRRRLGDIMQLSNNNSSKPEETEAQRATVMPPHEDSNPARLQLAYLSRAGLRNHNDDVNTTDQPLQSTERVFKRMLGKALVGLEGFMRGVSLAYSTTIPLNKVHQTPQTLAQLQQNNVAPAHLSLIMNGIGGSAEIQRLAQLLSDAMGHYFKTPVGMNNACMLPTADDADSHDNGDGDGDGDGILLYQDPYDIDMYNGLLIERMGMHLENDMQLVDQKTNYVMHLMALDRLCRAKLFLFNIFTCTRCFTTVARICFDHLGDNQLGTLFYDLSVNLWLLSQRVETLGAHLPPVPINSRAIL